MTVCSPSGIVAHRWGRTVLSALLGCALSACAAPGQKAVRSAHAQALEIPAAYREPMLSTEYGKRTGRAQRAYRDEVIAVYLDAIDNQYEVFTDRLDEEQVTSRLGFDGLLTLLSALAAIYPKDAADLAVMSSSTLAMQRSVDKNLYFERTSAALIAAMDAERLKVRTRIALKQNQDTAAYSLRAAIADLGDYRRAGKLREGVSSLTDRAVEARADAKEAFDRRIVLACDSEESVNVAASRIQDYKRRLFNTAEDEEATGQTTAINRMRAVADIMGVDPGGMSRIKLEAAIDDAFGGGFCKAEEVDELETRLRGANVGFQ